MKAKVLIVDDEEGICELLSRRIESMGHTTKYALTVREAYAYSQAEAFDFVYLDIHMPDGNGLEAIAKLRENSAMPEVMIMTGDASSAGVEIAMKAGAWDYIIKPATMAKMVLPLTRALEYRQAKIASKQAVLKRENIIGSSNEMKACLEKVAHVAGFDAHVLVTGETGTGKELISFAIHENSSRAAKSFVVVDCAALSPTLVESMLFGYEKGAFTGADKAQSGLILQANGGTIFLDELGELPLTIQKTFLRVLQEKRFRPIGSKTEVESDFRLIAATNRNLEKMVQKGTFRSDLLFRVQSSIVEVPSLKNHLGDIKELTQYYVGKLCNRKSIEHKDFSPEFIDVLQSYDWPGNIRELFNALETAVVEAINDPILYPKHLPTNIRVKLLVNIIDKKQEPDAYERAKPAGSLSRLCDVRQRAIDEAEALYIKHLKTLCGTDIKKACDISGLSRSRLYELIKKYEIKK